MKYMPSLPPPVTGVETGLEVKALAGVKRAKPVSSMQKLRFKVESAKIKK